MVTTIILVVLAVAGLATGVAAVVWLLLSTKKGDNRLQHSLEEAANTVTQAEDEKRTILLEAQEEALKIREAGDREIQEQRRELNRMERRHIQREEQLDRKVESLENHEAELEQRETKAQSALQKAEDLKLQHNRELERIASLSIDEARDIVLKRGEEEASHELARRYYELEKEHQTRADDNARRILTLAINRLATDVVSESTTSVVSLPNDEMKGRLIGREGRNIRALEAQTGVDIIVDDTPGIVTLSCFDPVRREIAKLALTQLVKDGRIQPARIEESVNRAMREIEETMWRAGEEATFEVGVSGLDAELIRLLGRLKYRYSYGENVLTHSIEVGLLSGMLASEVGANVQIAKAGGLLHDIGKALTHEIPGPHAEIGYDLTTRNGVGSLVCNCVLEHHDDDHSSIESFLVAAADGISAARPGARKESIEQYTRRLRELEETAYSFDGVQRAFAIQAGREVRVMVSPDDVDDVACASLARDIAGKVSKELQFPGQIKVTVIRETREESVAR
ncbi:MAG: ribonuclease Y [Dehalococcoidia bacterium]|nr:ribonuclease Y [Dehalococcoidia bacterium]